MPYWKKGERQVDCYGVPINPGDVLEQKELNESNAPWRYFICFKATGGNIEVRDLNANNVGMCNIGLDGDVKNIGHWTRHPEIEEDEWYHYFPEAFPDNAAEMTFSEREDWCDKFIFNKW